MTKIFLILAILAAAAASFFAWENKEAYAGVHERNTTLTDQIASLKRNNSNEQTAIDDAKAELATAQNQRDEEQARRDYSRSNLATRTREISTKRNELNQINTEIQEVTTILENYDLPTPEALNAALEEASARQIELQESIEEQEILAESLRTQVNDKRGVLTNLRRTLSDRNAAVTQRGRRAQVSAVDPTWEFAIINTNPAGVDVGDRVIVERQGQRVGMLVVRRVDQSQVVADVVSEANGGMRVRPGDTVIFDN